MPTLTYQELQEGSQLSEPDFKRLWATVWNHLGSEPEDSVGIAGPRPGSNSRSQASFHRWTFEYFKSGVGERFWGNAVQGKRTLSKDHADILEFFRKLVTHLAHAQRGCRRRRVREVHSFKNEGFEEFTDGLRSQLAPAVVSPFQQSRRHDNPEIVYVRDNTDSPLPSPLSVLENTLPLCFSAREHTPEDETPTPSKRIKLSQPEEADDLDPTPTISNRSASTTFFSTCTPDPNGADCVFKTRLAPETVITPVFAPLTIGFRDFFAYFREAWGIPESETMCAETVKVKVSISGSGEYQVGFGRSRERGWSHIMKLAEKIPEPEIVVHFEGDVSKLAPV